MHKRTAAQLDAMDPEKRAKVEAALARLHTPERLAAEEADREAIDRERADGSEIEASPIGTFEQVVDLARLAGRLRSAREALGLSLDDVAGSSKLQRSAISKLERGLTNPTARTFQRYATAIGMQIKVNLTPLPIVPPKVATGSPLMAKMVSTGCLKLVIRLGHKDKGRRTSPR